MGKASEQLLKAFGHVAREIQIYFLSGFLILLNVGLLDHFYHNGYLWQHTSQKPLFSVTVVIVAYVLGNACMGFYYVLFEWKGIDTKLNSILGFPDRGITAPEPALFKKDAKLYRYFVERYSLLVMMRWTLSSSFLIMSGMDFASWLVYNSHHRIIVTATFGNLALSACFYFLTQASEQEKLDRIDALNNIP
jgi:hypothetical protein